MKTIKFLALLLVALAGMTACSDDDDNTPKKIIDPYGGHQGCIFVSSRYFTNSYYGDQAVLTITQENNQSIVLFQDPQWGNGTFENVTIDWAHNTVSGTGTITMQDLHSGVENSYDAAINGDVTNPVITADLGQMGAIAIAFVAGPASKACQLHGNYKGINSVMVGGVNGPYTADITCKVTANPDGTLNVEIPEYMLNETLMGNLTLGKVTIKNVSYDETKKGFHRPYGKLDKQTMHLKAEGGMMNNDIDADFTFTEDSEIEVKTTETGSIRIVNSFRLGSMPFPIVATFEGTLASGN